MVVEEQAFAKINLTLDVLSKRGDGYHSIASVMQTIDLCDTLFLSESSEPGVQLSCESHIAEEIPEGEANLAWRGASMALKAIAETGRQTAPGHSLRLVKRIPAQAGLGGGSSDAAAALRAVNVLHGKVLRAEGLLQLASQLGSDVPFLVSGGAAVVRGRGEQIEPLPAGPELWLVIVKPQISVSTAWAYGAIDSMPDRVSHRMTGKMAEALKEGEARRIVSSQCNDFEAALFPEMPALAWLHDELIMAGAAAAHVCGSGAALYGMAESEAAAHKIAAQFQGRYPFVSVARTAPRQARFSSDGEGR